MRFNLLVCRDKRNHVIKFHFHGLGGLVVFVEPSEVNERRHF